MATGRMKPKYNATPTAREKAFHLWLMDSYPCVCGCGRYSTIVHHPLTRHPEQRWRRDHEFVVPMDAECHFLLHGVGSETAFRPDVRFDERAWQFRSYGYDAGVL